MSWVELQMDKLAHLPVIFDVFAFLLYVAVVVWVRIRKKIVPKGFKLGLVVLALILVWRVLAKVAS
jgi:hypothetical protein